MLQTHLLTMEEVPFLHLLLSSLKFIQNVSAVYQEMYNELGILLWKKLYKSTGLLKPSRKDHPPLQPATLELETI